MWNKIKKKASKSFTFTIEQKYKKNRLKNLSKKNVIWGYKVSNKIAIGGKNSIKGGFYV